MTFSKSHPDRTTVDDNTLMISDEYNWLLVAYSSLDYKIEVLPKVETAMRANIILECLKAEIRF